MKILILHASAGAGHKRAAEAVAKALPLEDASAQGVVRDILDFTGAMFRKTYAKGYLDVVRKAPELWAYMFAQSDRTALKPSRKAVRALFNEANAHAFRAFFDAEKPDAVVCTHFLPLELLSRTAGKHGQPPLHCVVTDFGVHSLWSLPHVDRYYVATEEARRELARKGQPADRIVVTGIPVDPVFAQSEPAAPVRRRLGLQEKLPTVLLLSGGFGVGPAVDLIRSFRDLDSGCQLLVVAGANERLKTEASAAAGAIRIPTKVFGFVNNIHELMDASDVVISKPGGLTTSEVLAKGKAMIVIDPIPGQEQRNCEYLLENGAALRLYEPEDALYKVQLLLANPPRLAQMQRSAREIGRPFAARDIARAVLSSPPTATGRSRRSPLRQGLRRARRKLDVLLRAGTT